MTMPKPPNWFDPKITMGTVITLLGMVFGGVWAMGRVVDTMDQHTARIEATEAAHYVELKHDQSSIADNVARALIENDKRRADLAAQEREDVREIRAILDQVRNGRRGGWLLQPEQEPG